MDAPSDRNIDYYRAEMQRHNVTDVVRACEPTYDKNALEKFNMKVHDWPFNDGEAPPEHVINDWLNLVEDRLLIPHLRQQQASSDATPSAPACIAVHCVAGLGRAPLLVAMALIEYANMPPLDSVIFIREKRRGAINARQLKYIERYKRCNRRKGLAQKVAATSGSQLHGKSKPEKCLVM